MSTTPNDPIRPQFVPDPRSGPIRVVLERPKASRLGTVLKWGAAILVGLIILGWINNTNYYESENAQVQERWHSLSKQPGSDKVAIISVSGTIMDGEGFAKAQIDKVRDDDRVKAVVLRVDSPGGTVTGSDYIYHHLKKVLEEKKIPLVVSMGGIAASGGYYIAMAAGDGEDRIFAEPTTWTGSIGVVIPHYDFSGLLTRFDVQDDSIASKPMKLMGSPTRDFPEDEKVEEQRILKGLVNDSYEEFKQIVLASRKQLRDDPELQEKSFTGQVFTAKQALERKLVDKIGFIEEAIDRAIELANLKKDDVAAVKYHRPQGLMDQLLFGPQSRQPAFDPLALVSLNTSPRAYYLFTWSPSLITESYR